MPSQPSQTEGHSRESTTHGNQGVQRGSIEANLGDLTPEQLAAYRKNRAEYDADRRAIEQWASDGFGAGRIDGAEERFDWNTQSFGSDNAREQRVVEAELAETYSAQLETPED